MTEGRGGDVTSEESRYIQAEALAADRGCVPENLCWPDCVDAALWSIERDHDTPEGGVSTDEPLESAVPELGAENERLKAENADLRRTIAVMIARWGG